MTLELGTSLTKPEGIDDREWSDFLTRYNDRINRIKSAMREGDAEAIRIALDEARADRIGVLESDSWEKQLPSGKSSTAIFVSGDQEDKSSEKR